VTPADLLNMAMESNTAYELMPVLCRLLNTPFPPQAHDLTPITTQKS